MALATRCPHCNTTFRVVHDQLKLRAGMVRCGSCQQVFNGIEHLIRANTPGTPNPDASTPSATPLSPAAPSRAIPIPVAAPAPAAPAASAPLAALPQAVSARPPVPVAPVPVTPAPIAAVPVAPEPVTPEPVIPEPALSEPLVQPAPAANAAAALAPPTVTPAPQSVASTKPGTSEVTPPARPAVAPARPATPAPQAEPEPISIKPAPVFEPAPAPVLEPDPAPVPETAPAAPSLAATLGGETLALSRIEPQLDDNSWPETKPAALELAAAMAHHQEPQLFDDSASTNAHEHAEGDDGDEPSFVKSGRRQQKLRRVWSLLQATCFVILLTALLAQSLYTWRDIIAVRWPASKIMLFNACTLLHCKVGLPTQIQQLSIELGELQVLPRNKNTFSYTTALRNHSGTVQAWPSIELVLLDANETPVARRVFAPTDYLSNPAESGKGIGAQAEQAIKLYFEFHQLKAASYRAEIFYP